LHSTPNVTRTTNLRRIKWVCHTACIGNIRNVYKVVVGKLKRKTPFGRHKYEWEYNIKMKDKDIEVKVLTGLNWFIIGPSSGF
jgi:hypothetical protein